MAESNHCKTEFYFVIITDFSRIKTIQFQTIRIHKQTQ
ncbi:hypothetical protein CCACVL1_10277 [Corchorus capsularis]|uniref:Uncharacterized protein n=1 Tax=Corchorus capsularis TaxID=210143 RepID=A0A1R3IRV0_COCAP|nr:hypothetical protein CCACVL1_10277 [Corchorus capsularis]